MINWIKNLFAPTPLISTFTNAEWEEAHAENKSRSASAARTEKAIEAVVKSVAPAVKSTAKRSPAKKTATPKAASGKRGRPGKK